MKSKDKKNRKKLLILIMSCRERFFQEEIRRIYDTWATKRSDNVDVMYYDGGWTENGVEGNHIKSIANDGLAHTYAKTVDAFHQVLNMDKYDWVFRVNTSTYVNIPLLEQFVETLAERDVLYASELYSLTEAPCPEPLSLYARGNAFLLSTDLIRVIVQDGINLLYMQIVDDVAIGNVLNSYFIKKTGNYDEYLKHIRGIPHGWYKASPMKFDAGHALCQYGEDKSGDEGTEFYNRFITVQTKMYRQREDEDQNMKELWDMMKDAPKPSLDTAIEYMKDPSVFIGSAIGYMRYWDWLRVDKLKLFAFEMENKAIDDKQSKYFSKEEYDRLHSYPKYDNDENVNKSSFTDKL